MAQTITQEQWSALLASTTNRPEDRKALLEKRRTWQLVVSTSSTPTQTTPTQTTTTPTTPTTPTTTWTTSWTTSTATTTTPTQTNATITWTNNTWQFGAWTTAEQRDTRNQQIAQWYIDSWATFDANKLFESIKKQSWASDDDVWNTVRDIESRFWTLSWTTPTKTTPDTPAPDTPVQWLSNAWVQDIPRMDSTMWAVNEWMTFQQEMMRNNEAMIKSYEEINRNLIAQLQQSNAAAAQQMATALQNRIGNISEMTNKAQESVRRLEELSKKAQDVSSQRTISAQARWMAERWILTWQQASSAATLALADQRREAILMSLEIEQQTEQLMAQTEQEKARMLDAIHAQAWVDAATQQAWASQITSMYDQMISVYMNSLLQQRSQYQQYMNSLNENNIALSRKAAEDVYVATKNSLTPEKWNRISANPGWRLEEARQMMINLWASAEMMAMLDDQLWRVIESTTFENFIPTTLQVMWDLRDMVQVSY